MNNEVTELRGGPRTEERLSAMRRHPAYMTDEAERLPAQAVVGVVHDFFRYGDPGATAALETYLIETGVGVHAETMLDELALLARIASDLPTGGAAA